MLAGGQSLVPIMAFRLAKPAHLVDINEVAGLDKIASDGKTLTIGACVRHAAFHKSVVDNPLGKLLTTVARHIAHYPIRMRGTFCGSLAHADPASEWCLTAATLDATMVAKSTRGERLIAAKDFFQGIMSTALAEDELLARSAAAAAGARRQIRLQRIQPPRRRFRAGRFARHLSSARRQDRRRRASASAAPKRVRAAFAEAEAALNGKAPGDDAFRAAAEAAAAAIDPLEDHQTNADYRRDLVRAVVRRALEYSGDMTAHTKGSGLKWVGRAIRRVEDPALITGQGRFTADLAAAHWVRFVRSPVAAGKIKNIKAPDGRDGHHRRRSQGREADSADAAQVQLQAGRPAGPGRRRRALCRRAGRRGRSRKRGSGRGPRRSGRRFDRRDHAGDRRACRARCGRAANSRRRARQCHPRRQVQDRPISTRSGAAQRKSSRSTHARAGRTLRRWRRAPATPLTMLRPAA